MLDFEYSSVGRTTGHVGHSKHTDVRRLESRHYQVLYHRPNYPQSLNF